MRDVAYEPFTCPTCGKSSDVHPTMDVSDAKTIFLCQDRAAKWQRVEPGTVIPTGQPYRVEYPEMLPECLASDQHGILAVDYDGLNLPFKPFQRSNFVETSLWFVDSSWKPPLVLPTEPTWGIVLSKNADRKDGHMADIGRWAVYGDEEWSPLERTHRSAIDTPCDVLSRQNIADFIPLTEEQVRRIEAHK